MKRHVTVGLLMAVFSTGLSAAPLHIAGGPVELALSEVDGGRTARIDLLPLDEQGKARSTPESTVFAPVQSTERLRIRDLDGARDVVVGRLKVSIRSQPLTLTVARADGRLVQELVIDEKDGSIIFRTEAPVFGLGEGRQQFDRRGFYYNFVN